MDREVVGEGYREDSLEDEDEQFAIENFVYWKEDQKRRRCMTVVQVMYYVVHAIYLMGLYKHSQYVDKSITQKNVDRENIKKEMKHLTSDERCRKEHPDLKKKMILYIIIKKNLFVYP